MYRRATKKIKNGNGGEIMTMSDKARQRGNYIIKS